MNKICRLKFKGSDPDFFNPEKSEKKKRFGRFYCHNSRRTKKLPPILPQKLINRQFKKCECCPYPNHGFLCWGEDGRCLRTILKRADSQK